MSATRYGRTGAAVYRLRYHLLWCAKYRKAVLVGGVAERLKRLLYEKAALLEVQIEALEVGPDHLRLVVSAPPTLAPQYLANQFKGYTSRVLRREFAHLRTQLPSLWSRRYAVFSAGQEPPAQEAIGSFLAGEPGR